MAEGGNPAAGMVVAGQRDTNNVSIQCPKLNKTNYSVWSVMMRTVLAANGLQGAINPVTGAAMEEKKKYTALAMLFQSIPEEIVMQVSKYTDPKDVWEALRVRYLGADRIQKARLQMLRSELDAIKMGENESIDDFATKLGALQSKSRTLGAELEEEIVVSKFLTAMPEKYLPIVSAIEQFAELETMSFEEVVGRLKTYEERNKFKSSIDESQNQLLFIKSDGKTKEKEHRCERCGCGSSNREDLGRGRGRGRGSGKDRGDGRVQRDKSHVRCYKCNEFGHYISECPKWEEKEEVNLTRYEDNGPALM